VDLCREIRLARFCDSPIFDSRLMSFGRFSATDSAHCTAVCTVFLCLNTCVVGLNLPQRAISCHKGRSFFFLPQRPILLPCGHFCLRSFDFCLPRGIHLPSLHHELINRLLCISHVHSPHRHLGGRDTDSFCMSFTLSFSSCSWSLMAAFLAWFHFELSTDSWSLVTAATASNGRLWID